MDPPVAVFEPDHVIQLRGRDFENVAVLKGDDPMLSDPTG